MTEIARAQPLIEAGWPIVRIDEVFSIQQGKQVSKKNRVGNNQRPFLRTKNVLWGHIDLSVLDLMHFSEKDEKRLSLRKGDLLLCEGGDVGRTAIWQEQVSGCYYQNHLHRLRGDRGEIDPEFALFWFWYAFKIGDVYFGRKNVTTIPNMSKSRLSELPMPKPDLYEQKNISSLLEKIRKAIVQQERLIELTAELKKTLMHKLFTEGTRSELQKQTEIGSVPESWEVLPLEDVLELTQYGLSVKGLQAGNYPILRMTNQVNGRIVLSNLQWVEISEDDFDKFSVKRGDLLFNRTNSYELVGRTAIFDLDSDCVFASYLIRLRVDDDRLNPFFLNHYFNSDITQNRLKSIATRAVSQSNISATRLKGFFVPLPSLEEQGEIVSYLDVLDSKVAQHEQRASNLKDLFRTLLHQLMTAQVRVNDLDLSDFSYDPVANSTEENI
jgi:type I restriction enzyme S subunit